MADDWNCGDLVGWVDSSPSWESLLNLWAKFHQPVVEWDSHADHRNAILRCLGLGGWGPFVSETRGQLRTRFLQVATATTMTGWRANCLYTCLTSRRGWVNHPAVLSLWKAKKNVRFSIAEGSLCFMDCSLDFGLGIYVLNFFNCKWMDFISSRTWWIGPNKEQMENAQTWKGGQILKAWNFEGKLTRSELGFDESRFFFDVMSSP